MWARRGATAVWCVTIAVVLSGCTLFRTAATTTTTTTTSVTTSTSSTTTTTLTASTSSSSTSTTRPAVVTCKLSSLSIKEGRSSGAVGTIALGFVITNTASFACTLVGFPVVTLVPVSGTVNPVVSHFGSATLVPIQGGAEAGFVLEYSDEGVDGQTSCPLITATVVKLPQVSGAPVTVATHFCPYGQPDITLSAVLSLAKYRTLTG